MLPVFERNQVQKKLDSLPPRSGTTSIGALAPNVEAPTSPVVPPVPDE